MQLVFRCFRALERFGDRVTGAAGPFFVTFAVAMMTSGTVCFCACLLHESSVSLESSFHYIDSVDVIAPTLNYPLLSIPICVLIALNLTAHYYYVLTVSPGFVEDGPRAEGAGLLWATKRKPMGGVHWSDGDVRTTKAGETRCRKCLKIRPEVSKPILEKRQREELIGVMTRGHTIVEYATDAS